MCKNLTGRGRSLSAARQVYPPQLCGGGTADRIMKTASISGVVFLLYNFKYIFNKNILKIEVIA